MSLGIYYIVYIKLNLNELKFDLNDIKIIILFENL